MDKKLAALLGAAAAVATAGGAQAATRPSANSSEALDASSYADLLAPVPNAVEYLEADEMARARTPAEANGRLARDRHHDHHSSVVVRHPSDHHHHHHHHKSGVFIGIPGVAGVTVGSGNEDDHHDHDEHHD